MDEGTPLPNKRPFETPDTEAFRFAKKNQSYTHGNNKPIYVERNFADLKVVKGNIPLDLEGMIARNGPNPRYDVSAVPYHNFDGDGMIHTVSFEAGKCNYSNRFVKTNKLQIAEERGWDIYGMGEMQAGARTANYSEGLNPGNTNVVGWNGKVYALCEPFPPLKISLSHIGKENLQTIGEEDFDGQLNHSLSAHTAIDTRTGEMMMFTYSIYVRHPKISYAVINSQGKIKTSVDIPLEIAAMVHDIGITQNYSIFYNMQYLFSMKDAFKGLDPWTHHREKPGKIGVLPRHCKKAEQVVWVDIKPGALFHFLNCWEEHLDGVDCLVIYGVQSEKVNINIKEASPTLLHKWIIDLKTMRCIFDEILDDIRVQFPQIDKINDGYKIRYGYAAGLVAREKATTLIDSFKTNKAVKFDLKNGTYLVKELVSSTTKAPLICSEIVFAASKERPNSHGEHEDDGYLICFVHDEVFNRSGCMVLSAKDLSTVAEIEIPQRVPYGFHACWIEKHFLQQSKL